MTNLDSGQEIFEGRQYRARYVAMDMRQPVGNRHAAQLLWGSLTETYVEGRCEVHVHFRAGLVNGGVAGDWCAVFNQSKDWLDFVGSEAFDPEGNRSGPEKRDVRQAVLVLDGKLVELPKGVIGSVVPSAVRLQPLYLCLGAWGDAPKHAVEFARILLEEDRKRGIAFDAGGHWPALAGDGELNDEIVESGTQVVDAVTDDELSSFAGGGLRTSTKGAS